LPSLTIWPKIRTISSCRFAWPRPGSKNRPTDSTTFSRSAAGCIRSTWIGG